MSGEVVTSIVLGSYNQEDDSLGSYRQLIIGIRLNYQNATQLQSSKLHGSILEYDNTKIDVYAIKLNLNCLPLKYEQCTVQKLCVTYY